MMFTAFWDILTVDNLIYLFKGAMVALSMAALSLLIGLIFGILGASAKISKNRFLRILGNIYVEVIRGTPMLLQIMLIFNVVPIIITQITGNVFRMDYFLIGVVAMSINSGAYTTELIRSGINGVDKGQWEACEACQVWKEAALSSFTCVPRACLNRVTCRGSVDMRIFRNRGVRQSIYKCPLHWDIIIRRGF